MLQKTIKGTYSHCEHRGSKKYNLPFGNASEHIDSVQRLPECALTVGSAVEQKLAGAGGAATTALMRDGSKRRRRGKGSRNGSIAAEKVCPPTTNVADAMFLVRHPATVLRWAADSFHGNSQGPIAKTGVMLPVTLLLVVRDPSQQTTLLFFSGLML